MTMGAQTEFGNLIGRFTDLPTLHDVEGAVYAVDERTFYVRGFSYDGTGPGKIKVLSHDLVSHQFLNASI